MFILIMQDLLGAVVPSSDFKIILSALVGCLFTYNTMKKM